MYVLTLLLGAILAGILFKNVGQDLWKERHDLAAGAKSLSLGGVYLVAVVAAVFVVITVGLLAWKLLLFAWN